MENDQNLPTSAATPPPSNHRLYWIGGAIAGCLFACLLCTGAGVGLSIYFNIGPLAQPEVVGKWENVDGLGKIEFKSDGTGTIEAPNLFAEHEDIPVDVPEVNPPKKASKKTPPKKKADKVLRSSFKWHVEHETKPVLVVDKDHAAGFLILSKHSHFKREGETLTITPLSAAFPPIVLRRLK